MTSRPDFLASVLQRPAAPCATHHRGLLIILERRRNPLVSIHYLLEPGNARNKRSFDLLPLLPSRFGYRLFVFGEVLAGFSYSLSASAEYEQQGTS